jgi:phage N-6-adenine-methyltransferase
MDNTLVSNAETARLVELEGTIERGMRTFVDVGSALLEIRDSRLYRTTHGTFEDYCRERWGWERRHAYRMIDAAQATENVSNWTQIAPATESQARPLTALEPEQQREAWQRAVETAPNGKVTAAHVQGVVDEYQSEYDFNREQIIEANRQGASIEVPPKMAHVSHNSGNNEWYTPKEYVDAARSVMGGIDCDPASSEIANRTVQARTYYTAEEDGLAYEWNGRVWMNPPYAQPLVAQFCEALVAQYGKTVTEACVLVNNATDTGWFHTLLDIANAVCFLRGRVRFIDMEGKPSGAPLQGQAIVYCGPNVTTFEEWFGWFGTVLYAEA